MSNLINSEDASKVVIKLLDMIEKTVGWIALPKGNRADFEDGLNTYKEGILSDDNLSYIEKAQKISVASRELKEYVRQYEVVTHAVNNLSPEAKPDSIDPDWLSTLFSYVRNCSNEYMQMIWGQLLASKANGNSDIPKKILHVFSCIEQEDIDTFCRLCSFTFDNLGTTNSCYPFIYIKDNPSFYNNNKIYRYHLASLHNLGLIEYDIHSHFVLPSKVPELKYDKFKIVLHSDSRIDYGNVRLTKAGRTLYQITISDKSRSFLDTCCKIWEQKNIVYHIQEIY